MTKSFISSIFIVAYGALLIKLLVFKEVTFKIGHLMFNFSGGGSGPANFIPFKTILPYLLGEKGWVITIFELAGNIGLLIPVGFFIPFIYQKMTWQKSLILSIVIPLIIEIVQVLLQVGIFDIDDIILNGLGVMIGYSIYSLLQRYF